MLGAIDRSRFEVVPIGITRDGAFVLEDDNPEKFALDAERLPTVEDNGTRVRWPESIASRETFVERDDARESLGDIDVVLPILHGPYGEDGTVQGFFELIGLPYVGSGVMASAVAMDKHMTKTVLQQGGVPVAPWHRVTRAAWEAGRVDGGRLLEEIGLPAFVKPNRAGSSVGVSRVDDPADLDAALRTAFAEDVEVLIEKGLDGREVEIAVLGGGPDETARTSEVAGEIVVTGRAFYDFDAKYRGASGIDLVCPADIEPERLALMKRLALQAFAAVGAEGMARVDFFLTDDGFVLNEVNTLPGFTPISMFPTCWIESGLSYSDLISELIEVAASRGPR